MRLAPGVLVVAAGVVLLTAGLLALFGWQITALAIGALLVSVGVWSYPAGGGGTA